MFTTVTHQQPVTWQPSKDGERLIGRILLNKRMKDGTVPADTGALLGLKVMHSSSSFFFFFCVQLSALLMASVFRWSGGRWRSPAVSVHSSLRWRGEVWLTLWDTWDQVNIHLRPGSSATSLVSYHDTTRNLSSLWICWIVDFCLFWWRLLTFCQFHPASSLCAKLSHVPESWTFILYCSADIVPVKTQTFSQVHLSFLRWSGSGVEWSGSSGSHL